MSESRARGLKGILSISAATEIRSSLKAEVIHHYLLNGWIREEDVAEFEYATSVSASNEELTELLRRAKNTGPCP